MGDNERRAEIERTECAICGKAGYWAHRFDGDHPAHSYKPIQRKYVPLDRLRDARGDDEACGECEMTEGHAQWCSLARSPQGEDHEARIGELEADRDYWRNIARTVAPDYPVVAIPTDTLEAISVRAEAAEAEVERLRSPSRDGTWAERFRRAADEAERRGPSEGVDPLIHTAMVEAYRTQADELSPPPPEYMTEADAHRWVDEHIVPPASRYLAHALVSSLPRVAPPPSRDGTVAVEDVLMRIGERVMTFGGFQRTERGEFWVARDDVMRLLAEFARPATGEQTGHGG
jgi:hypothetical protein